MQNNIRKYREQSGLTQLSLAIKANVQPGLLCRYEKGQRPNQINARRIADALGRDVVKVFPDFKKFRNY